MACFETGTVVNLSAREAITLPNIQGTTLRVTRGTLWLTEEKQRNDFVLRAGDNFVVESDGATVVEAQGAALFCVVGRRADTLRAPVRARKSALWSMLAGVLTPPPRHHAPYA